MTKKKKRRDSIRKASRGVHVEEDAKNFVAGSVAFKINYKAYKRVCLTL